MREKPGSTTAWNHAPAAIVALILLLSSPPLLRTIQAAGSLGLWTLLPMLVTPHEDHTATLLLDGKLLVAGGYLGASPESGMMMSSAAELYRPATNDWLSVPPMATGRRL